MSRADGPTGFLVVDKPPGMTSHDVVDRVRRLFRTKRVGHTGTLDPDATGILVLCLGAATRIAEYLTASSKHYSAEFVFGARTDTMDGSGATIEERDASGLTAEDVAGLLPAFRGRIEQIPPMVSARKHAGQRLYALARDGITVERESRPVTISQLEMTSFQSGPRATATLEVTCSSGTYIRVLADDLGATAGTGAYMSALRRTWVGEDEPTGFRLADAHALEELESMASVGAADRALLSLADGLRGMEKLQIDDGAACRLCMGQPAQIDLPAHGGATSPTGDLAAALCGATVVAIVRRTGDVLRPVKVLASR
ncbi:MAG TPA: tRNA pseudouridine(55) synthase TruB [Chthonomonadaceae bacterium]|nr:tRNA pseudouridine(55) synthase TruB [Chthonomonadaceae bacterium]